MVDRAAQSKSHDICRICRSTNLHEYLDLGRTPLANSYLRAEDLQVPEFKEELKLQVCTDCGLSQLTKVVNPDLMFRNYLYVSSTPKTFRDHCVELAKTSVAMAGCRKGEWVLDIASNDGCLLSKFRDLEMSVVGVDPAENLAAEANQSGIPTLCDYWSTTAAESVLRRFGRPRIITATNVLGHTDDLHEFVRAVDHCLDPAGIFVLECPYVLDFIEKNEFDTAYHEHLSYLAIHPLRMLMEEHGFAVCNVQYFHEIHGGTIRVFVGRSGRHPVDSNVALYLKKEEAFGIQTIEPYEAFRGRVEGTKEKLLSLLGRLQAGGKAMWAYGASAKGNTLTNYFGITKDLIPVVIDDNPKKWGWYTPGSHMRITGIDELVSSRVDYLLLLAWNFQTEIKHRCRMIKYPGDFIVPVPGAKIIR